MKCNSGGVSQDVGLCIVSTTANLLVAQERPKVLIRTLSPGGTPVVHGKIVGSSQSWRIVMETTQNLAAIATAAAAVKNM